VDVGPPEEYLLGPDDQVKIWALGMGEIPATPQRIDPAGYVDLPVLGRIRAAGLSLSQFKEALLASLAKEVLKPQVSVEIAEFGSQPVSVMGAVNTPGVHQLRSRKTLAEVLSMAGGLRSDAGAVIKITRLASWGPIPLPGATLDPTGRYNVAEVGVKDFLSAKDPAQNILIRPNDVLAVPAAEMVYVIGAVRKPGGFGLTERDGISALHALSMAEGLGPSLEPAGRPKSRWISQRCWPAVPKILCCGPTIFSSFLRVCQNRRACELWMPLYKWPQEWSFGVIRRVKTFLAAVYSQSNRVGQRTYVIECHRNRGSGATVPWAAPAHHRCPDL
jgi:protein involved in polysaccharide export with SLBB domain